MLTARLRKYATEHYLLAARRLELELQSGRSSPWVNLASLIELANYAVSHPLHRIESLLIGYSITLGIYLITTIISVKLPLLSDWLSGATAWIY